MKATSRIYLEALAAHLSPHGLTTQITLGGLLVKDPSTLGCCQPHPTDLITVRRRDDDAGCLWFFTSWGEPLAPVDRVTDAVVAVRGWMARRAPADNR